MKITKLLFQNAMYETHSENVVMQFNFICEDAAWCRSDGKLFHDLAPHIQI